MIDKIVIYYYDGNNKVELSAFAYRGFIAGVPNSMFIDVYYNGVVPNKCIIEVFDVEQGPNGEYPVITENDSVGIYDAIPYEDSLTPDFNVRTYIFSIDFFKSFMDSFDDQFTEEKVLTHLPWMTKILYINAICQDVNGLLIKAYPDYQLGSISLNQSTSQIGDLVDEITTGVRPYKYNPGLIPPTKPEQPIEPTFIKPNEEPITPNIKTYTDFNVIVIQTIYNQTFPNNYNVNQANIQKYVNCVFGEPEDNPNDIEISIDTIFEGCTFNGKTTVYSSSVIFDDCIFASHNFNKISLVLNSSYEYNFNRIKLLNCRIDEYFYSDKYYVYMYNTEHAQIISTISGFKIENCTKRFPSLIDSFTNSSVYLIDNPISNYTLNNSYLNSDNSFINNLNTTNFSYIISSGDTITGSFNLINSYISTSYSEINVSTRNINYGRFENTIFGKSDHIFQQYNTLLNCTFNVLSNITNNGYLYYDAILQNGSSITNNVYLEIKNNTFNLKTIENNGYVNIENTNLTNSIINNNDNSKLDSSYDTHFTLCNFNSTNSWIGHYGTFTYSQINTTNSYIYFYSINNSTITSTDTFSYYNSNQTNNIYSYGYSYNMFLDSKYNLIDNNDNTYSVYISSQYEKINNKNNSYNKFVLSTFSTINNYNDSYILFNSGMSYNVINNNDDVYSKTTFDIINSNIFNNNNAYVVYDNSTISNSILNEYDNSFITYNTCVFNNNYFDINDATISFLMCNVLTGITLTLDGPSCLYVANSELDIVSIVANCPSKVSYNLSTINHLGVATYCTAEMNDTLLYNTDNNLVNYNSLTTNNSGLNKNITYYGGEEMPVYLYFYLTQNNQSLSFEQQYNPDIPVVDESFIALDQDFILMDYDNSYFKITI